MAYIADTELQYEVHAINTMYYDIILHKRIHPSAKLNDTTNILDIKQRARVRMLPQPASAVSEDRYVEPPRDSTFFVLAVLCVAAAAAVFFVAGPWLWTIPLGIAWIFISCQLSVNSIHDRQHTLETYWQEDRDKKAATKAATATRE